MMTLRVVLVLLLSFISNAEKYYEWRGVVRDAESTIALCTAQIRSLGTDRRTIDGSIGPFTLETALKHRVESCWEWWHRADGQDYQAVEEGYWAMTAVVASKLFSGEIPSTDFPKACDGSVKKVIHSIKHTKCVDANGKPSGEPFDAVKAELDAAIGKCQEAVKEIQEWFEENQDGMKVATTSLEVTKFAAFQTLEVGLSTVMSPVGASALVAAIDSTASEAGKYTSGAYHDGDWKNILLAVGTNAFAGLVLGRLDDVFKAGGDKIVKHIANIPVVREACEKVVSKRAVDMGLEFGAEATEEAVEELVKAAFKSDAIRDRFQQIANTYVSGCIDEAAGKEGKKFDKKEAASKLYDCLLAQTFQGKDFQGQLANVAGGNFINNLHKKSGISADQIVKRALTAGA